MLVIDGTPAPTLVQRAIAAGLISLQQPDPVPPDVQRRRERNAAAMRKFRLNRKQAKQLTSQAA